MCTSMDEFPGTSGPKFDDKLRYLSVTPTRLTKRDNVHRTRAYYEINEHSSITCVFAYCTYIALGWRSCIGINDPSVFKPRDLHYYVCNGH